MKLIIDIPNNVYANLMAYCEHHGIVEAVYGYIYHGTPIPDNATNGDCVRKLFCKGIYRTSVRTNVSVEFKRDWWNTPYQKGGK